MKKIVVAVALLAPAGACFCQKAELRPATPIEFPGAVDSNSPAHWFNGELFVFNSAGLPVRSSGKDQFHLRMATATAFSNYELRTRWIEATWTDDDGTVYAWYHHEPHGLCPGTSLTAPRIGALKSIKNGNQFDDLGLVLTHPEVDCKSENGWFAGGHGDFSVILDRDHKYFYFLFSSYYGDASDQGVAVARMAYADRDKPVAKVWKYFKSGWEEPGLGGRVTPVFAPTVSWKRKDSDAFWGPSIHWNTYLGKYVMLMNRSCCEAGWPQEGIYVTFNDDVANPEGWSKPVKIMDGPKKGFDGSAWYPQILGLDTAAHETDKLAGRIARFYLAGRSEWEIVFTK